MKSLIKGKIKSILPMLIIGAVALVASVILVSVNTREIYFYKTYGSCVTYFVERIFTHLYFLPFVLIPLAIAMGMVLTKEYGRYDQEAFLAGLPFKKRDRYLATVLPGVLFFVIFTVVLLVAVVINYSITYEYYHEIYMTNPEYELLVSLDSLGNAIMRILQIMFAPIMIYAISIFAGIISRQNAVTVFVILMIVLFPLYIIPSIQVLVGDGGILSKVGDYSSLVGLFMEAGITDDYNLIYYFDYLTERTVTTGIISIVYLVLGYFVANMKDRSSGKILVGKHSDSVFIVIAGIYASFLLVLFKDIIGLSVGILVVLMLVIFALIVFLLYRYVSTGKKYDYLNKKEGAKDEK